MICSMTGFGRAEEQCGHWTVLVEAKSVNHRDLQISFRVPDMLQAREHKLQKLAEKKLHRGHVYVNVSCRYTTESAAMGLNAEAARDYLGALKEIANSADLPVQVDLAALLRLPGVLKDTAVDETDAEELWPGVERATEACLDKLVEMRRAEGANLNDQLSDLADGIEAHTSAIEKAQDSFVPAYRDRLRERIARLLEGTDVSVREDSLAREVAIYADRCDVSEEIARLRSHVQQFRQALETDGKPVGRRMEFIGQEMLREGGTIAAKVPSGVQVQEVLELKSDVDRLREQVRNVE